jgi:hypothetical protein
MLDQALLFGDRGLTWPLLRESFQVEKFDGVFSSDLTRGKLPENLSVRLSGLLIPVFVAEFYIRSDQKTVLEFVK